MATPLVVCMQDSRGEEVALNVEPGDDFSDFLRKANSLNCILNQHCKRCLSRTQNCFYLKENTVRFSKTLSHINDRGLYRAVGPMKWLQKKRERSSSHYKRKHRELLGFEIDISCITKTQVSLSENIYNFLVNADEQQLNPTILRENAESVPESLSIHGEATNDNCVLSNETPSEAKTQNDGPSVLDVEKAEIKDETPSTPPDEITVTITQSPTYVHEENHASEFFDTLPFKPVCNNVYKNLMRNRQNLEVKYEPNNAGILVDDLSSLTRNQVVTLLKNSPVIKTIEFIEDERKEIQNHVRKTAPNKLPKEPAQNNLRMDANVTSTRRNNRNICFICDELIQNQFEEIYVFNSEDQKACRSSPKKELAASLKVTCNACLEMYFIYCTEILTERTLENDEYLVIRRNQQYLYKRILPLPIRTTVTQILFDKYQEINLKGTEIELPVTDREEDIIKSPQTNKQANDESEKKIRPECLDVAGNVTGVQENKMPIIEEVVIIDSDENDDGNEVETEVSLAFRENENTEEKANLKITDTKSFSKDESDKNIVYKEVSLEKREKSEPEKQEYDEVEFLEDYEDIVKESCKELKCRFCDRVFENLVGAVEHGTEHRLDKENIFPCPLCEYGYQTYLWLRGHMYSKHETGGYKKREEVTTPTPSYVSSTSEDTPAIQSPVATRTRSSTTRKRPAPGKKKEKNVKKSKKTMVSGKMDGQRVDKPTTAGKKTKASKRRKEEKNETDDEPLTVESKSQPTTLGKKTKVSKILKEEKLEADDEPLKEEKPEMEVEPVTEESKSHNEEAISSPEKRGINKTYSCHFCKKRFISKATLHLHEARKCKMPKIIENKNGCITVIDSTRVLSQKTLFKQTQNRGPRKDKVLDENTGIFHQKYPNVKMKIAKHANTSVMTCDYCKKTFTSKVRLQYHMQFHRPSKLVTADGEYLCEKCPTKSTFATESELFDHVHFTHERRRKWLCPVVGCRKTFFVRAMLTKHGRKHTNTRRYICTECGKGFLDKQTLDEHSVTHLKTKPFQCHICLKHLTRRSRLRMHLRSHQECLSPKALRVCRLCSRAFKNLPEAQEHAASSDCAVKMEDSKELLHQADVQLTNVLDLKISEEIKMMTEEMSEETRRVIAVVKAEKVFRCEYCDDVFFEAERLNGHRVQHRGVPKPFICHICKVTFPTYARCTTHKTTHGYYKRPVNPQNPPQKADTKHAVDPKQTNVIAQTGDIKETGDPTKQTSDTQKTDDSKEIDAGPRETVDLKKRVDPNQTGKPKHEVDVCISDIVGYGDFPVAKHFLCADCGRSYLHWTYLQVHRRFKHPTVGQVFMCSECGLPFPNSWGLAYHKRRTHAPTGEIRRENVKYNSKPTIPCRDCQETFTNKSALYTHRRKLHPKRLDLFKEAMNVECSTNAPGPEGPENNTLESPKDACSRKDHACPVCGRGFRSASICMEHLRVHTGERPFPCDVCGLAFRRSTARNNHRLIHTGEKAFPCARCSKSFRIRSDLNTHVKTKHAEQTLVLEMYGLNPDPAEVILQLRVNNIALDKVVQVSKVSFAKGSTNLVMSGDASALVNVDAQDDASRAWSERLKEAIDATFLPRPKLLPLPDCDAPRGMLRRARGASRSLPRRTPEALQLQYKDTDTCHVQLNDLAVEEVTQLLGGVLTCDGKGILLTSGQFVPFEAVSLDSSISNNDQPMEDVQQTCDPESIAQPVQQNLYISEGMTQPTQDSFYISENILRPVQQSLYYPEGLTQAMQKNLYIAENTIQQVQQNLYNPEGTTQAVQQNLYNIEGIAQPEQQNLYNPEGITQAMQQILCNKDGTVELPQGYVYNIEVQHERNAAFNSGNVVQLQQDETLCFIDSTTHSVQQNLYNSEGIAQTANHDQNNLQDVQTNQQTAYTSENIAEPVQHNLYTPNNIAKLQQQTLHNDGNVYNQEGNVHLQQVNINNSEHNINNSIQSHQEYTDITKPFTINEMHSPKSTLHTLQNVQPSESPYTTMAPSTDSYPYQSPQTFSGEQPPEQNMYNINVNTMQPNDSVPSDGMQFQQNIYYPEGYVQQNLYNIQENNQTRINTQIGEINMDNVLKVPKSEKNEDFIQPADAKNSV